MGQGPELWFVNTRFSCLCTRSPEYSFQPRWRPRFVTQLAPEDRCHLNGLGVVEGRPKYVTALGECDEAGGWRKNKKDGGVLIDIESDEVIARGCPCSIRRGGIEGSCGFFIQVPEGWERSICGRASMKS